MARPSRTAVSDSFDDDPLRGLDPDTDNPEPKPSYEVGYGKPPIATRFKPGQSGHKAGRPPRSRTIKTIVKQVLEDSMDITIKGRKKRAPAIEALVRYAFARSFKGDTKAFAMLISLMKLAGYGAETDDGLKDALDGVDHDAVLSDYLARNGHFPREEG